MTLRPTDDAGGAPCATPPASQIRCEVPRGLRSCRVGAPAPPPDMHDQGSRTRCASRRRTGHRSSAGGRERQCRSWRPPGRGCWEPAGEGSPITALTAASSDPSPFGPHPVGRGYCERAVALGGDVRDDERVQAGPLGLGVPSGSNVSKEGARWRSIGRCSPGAGRSDRPPPSR